MKKVYLIPNNNISQELFKTKKFINKYKLISFVDKNSKLSNTIDINNINKEAENIIICSPNYWEEIYKELIALGINKKRIKFYINKLDRIINSLKLVNYLEIGSLEDYINVKRFKNIHKNKRAFVIGNGPSLSIGDLDLLKDEITFASNKIYLSYSETEWRAKYYFVEDDLVFTQNYDEIKGNTLSYKFFPLYSQYWNKRIENSTYFDLIYEPDSKDFPNFKPLKSFYWGSTVVYTMIQWAIYMGIKEIYLLGVDFNFKVPDKKTYNKELKKFDLISQGEINHFHKDYRKEGEKWNLPNLDIQSKSFRKVKEYCEINNIKIYNASKGTKLGVIPIIEKEKVFEKMLNTQ